MTERRRGKGAVSNTSFMRTTGIIPRPETSTTGNKRKRETPETAPTATETTKDRHKKKKAKSDDMWDALIASRNSAISKAGSRLSFMNPHSVLSKPGDFQDVKLKKDLIDLECRKVNIVPGPLSEDESDDGSGGDDDDSQSGSSGDERNSISEGVSGSIDDDYEDEEEESGENADYTMAANSFTTTTTTETGLPELRPIKLGLVGNNLAEVQHSLDQEYMYRQMAEGRIDAVSTTADLHSESTNSQPGDPKPRSGDDSRSDTPTTHAPPLDPVWKEDLERAYNIYMSMIEENGGRLATMWYFGPTPSLQGAGSKYSDAYKKFFEGLAKDKEKRESDATPSSSSPYLGFRNSKQPIIPIVKRKHIADFLRPPILECGERACANGERCISVSMFVQSYLSNPALFVKNWNLTVQKQRHTPQGSATTASDYDDRRTDKIHENLGFLLDPSRQPFMGFALREFLLPKDEKDRKKKFDKKISDLLCMDSTSHFLGGRWNGSENMIRDRMKFVNDHLKGLLDSVNHEIRGFCVLCHLATVSHLSTLNVSSTTISNPGILLVMQHHQNVFGSVGEYRTGTEINRGPNPCGLVAPLLQFHKSNYLPGRQIVHYNRVGVSTDGSRLVLVSDEVEIPCWSENQEIVCRPGDGLSDGREGEHKGVLNPENYKIVVPDTLKLFRIWFPWDVNIELNHVDNYGVSFSGNRHRRCSNTRQTVWNTNLPRFLTKVIWQRDILGTAIHSDLICKLVFRWEEGMNHIITDEDYRRFFSEWYVERIPFVVKQNTVYFALLFKVNLTLKLMDRLYGNLSFMSASSPVSMPPAPTSVEVDQQQQQQQKQKQKVDVTIMGISKVVGSTMDGNSGDRNHSRPIKTEDGCGCGGNKYGQSESSAVPILSSSSGNSENLRESVKSHFGVFTAYLWPDMPTELPRRRRWSKMKRLLNLTGPGPGNKGENSGATDEFEEFMSVFRKTSKLLESTTKKASPRMDYLLCLTSIRNSKIKRYILKELRCSKEFDRDGGKEKSGTVPLPVPTDTPESNFLNRLASQIDEMIELEDDKIRFLVDKGRVMRTDLMAASENMEYIATFNGLPEYEILDLVPQQSATLSSPIPIYVVESDSEGHVEDPGLKSTLDLDSSSDVGTAPSIPSREHNKSHLMTPDGSELPIPRDFFALEMEESLGLYQTKIANLDLRCREWSSLKDDILNLPSSGTSKSETKFLERTFDEFFSRNVQDTSVLLKKEDSKTYHVKSKLVFYLAHLSLFCDWFSSNWGAYCRGKRSLAFENSDGDGDTSPHPTDRKYFKRVLKISLLPSVSMTKIPKRPHSLDLRWSKKLGRTCLDLVELSKMRVSRAIHEESTNPNDFLKTASSLTCCKSVVRPTNVFSGYQEEVKVLHETLSCLLETKSRYLKSKGRSAGIPSRPHCPDPAEVPAKIWELGSMTDIYRIFKEPKGVRLVRDAEMEKTIIEMFEWGERAHPCFMRAFGMEYRPKVSGEYGILDLLGISKRNLKLKVRVGETANTTANIISISESDLSDRTGTDIPSVIPMFGSNHSLMLAFLFSSLVWERLLDFLHDQFSPSLTHPSVFLYWYSPTAVKNFPSFVRYPDFGLSPAETSKICGTRWFGEKVLPICMVNEKIRCGDDNRRKATVEIHNPLGHLYRYLQNITNIFSHQLPSQCDEVSRMECEMISFSIHRLRMTLFQLGRYILARRIVPDVSLHESKMKASQFGPNGRELDRRDCSDENIPFSILYPIHGSGSPGCVDSYLDVQCFRLSGQYLEDSLPAVHRYALEEDCDSSYIIGGGNGCGPGGVGGAAAPTIDPTLVMTSSGQRSNTTASSGKPGGEASATSDLGIVNTKAGGDVGEEEELDPNITQSMEPSGRLFFSMFGEHDHHNQGQNQHQNSKFGSGYASTRTGGDISSNNNTTEGNKRGKREGRKIFNAKYRKNGNVEEMLGDNSGISVESMSKNLIIETTGKGVAHSSGSSNDSSGGSRASSSSTTQGGSRGTKAKQQQQQQQPTGADSGEDKSSGMFSSSVCTTKSLAMRKLIWKCIGLRARGRMFQVKIPDTSNMEPIFFVLISRMLFLTLTGGYKRNFYIPSSRVATCLFGGKLSTSNSSRGISCEPGINSAFDAENGNFLYRQGFGRWWASPSSADDLLNSPYSVSLGDGDGDGDKSDSGDDKDDEIARANISDFVIRCNRIEEVAGNGRFFNYNYRPSFLSVLVLSTLIYGKGFSAQQIDGRTANKDLFGINKLIISQPCFTHFMVRELYESLVDDANMRDSMCMHWEEFVRSNGLPLNAYRMNYDDSLRGLILSDFSNSRTCVPLSFTLHPTCVAKLLGGGDRTLGSRYKFKSVPVILGGSFEDSLPKIEERVAWLSRILDKETPSVLNYETSLETMKYLFPVGVNAQKFETYVLGVMKNFREKMMLSEMKLKDELDVLLDVISKLKALKYVQDKICETEFPETEVLEECLTKLALSSSDKVDHHRGFPLAMWDRASVIFLATKGIPEPSNLKDNRTTTTATTSNSSSWSRRSDSIALGFSAWVIIRRLRPLFDTITFQTKNVFGSTFKQVSLITQDKLGCFQSPKDTEPVCKCSTALSLKTYGKRAHKQQGSSADPKYEGFKGISKADKSTFFAMETINRLCRDGKEWVKNLESRCMAEMALKTGELIDAVEALRLIKLDCTLSWRRTFDLNPEEKSQIWSYCLNKYSNFDPKTGISRSNPILAQRGSGLGYREETRDEILSRLNCTDIAERSCKGDKGHGGDDDDDDDDDDDEDEESTDDEDYDEDRGRGYYDDDTPVDKTNRNSAWLSLPVWWSDPTRRRNFEKFTIFSLGLSEMARRYCRDLSLFGGSIVGQEEVSKLDSLIRLYEKKASPKSTCKILGNMSLMAFKKLYYIIRTIRFVVSIELLDIPQDVSVRIHHAFDKHKYKLMKGETVTDECYDVYMTPCCERVCNYSNPDSHGNFRLSYSSHERTFTCARKKTPKCKILGGYDDNWVNQAQILLESETTKADLSRDLRNLKDPRASLEARSMISDLETISEKAAKRMVSLRVKIKEQEMAGIKQTGNSESARSKNNDKIARRHEKARSGTKCSDTEAIKLHMNGKSLRFGTKRPEVYTFCPLCASFHSMTCYSKEKNGSGSNSNTSVSPSLLSQISSGSSIVNNTSGGIGTDNINTTALSASNTAANPKSHSQTPEGASQPPTQHQQQQQQPPSQAQATQQHQQSSRPGGFYETFKFGEYACRICTEQMEEGRRMYRCEYCHSFIGDQTSRKSALDCICVDVRTQSERTNQLEQENRPRPGSIASPKSRTSSTAKGLGLGLGLDSCCPKVGSNMNSTGYTNDGVGIKRFVFCEQHEYKSKERAKFQMGTTSMNKFEWTLPSPSPSSIDIIAPSSWESSEIADPYNLRSNITGLQDAKFSFKMDRIGIPNHHSSDSESGQTLLKCCSCWCGTDPDLDENNKPSSFVTSEDRGFVYRLQDVFDKNVGRVKERGKGRSLRGCLNGSFGRPPSHFHKDSDGILWEYTFQDLNESGWISEKDMASATEISSQITRSDSRFNGFPEGAILIRGYENAIDLVMDRYYNEGGNSTWTKRLRGAHGKTLQRHSQSKNRGGGGGGNSSTPRVSVTPRNRNQTTVSKRGKGGKSRDFGTRRTLDRIALDSSDLSDKLDSLGSVLKCSSYVRPGEEDKASQQTPSPSAIAKMKALQLDSAVQLLRTKSSCACTCHFSHDTSELDFPLAMKTWGGEDFDLKTANITSGGHDDDEDEDEEHHLLATLSALEAMEKRNELLLKLIREKTMARGRIDRGPLKWFLFGNSFHTSKMVIKTNKGISFVSGGGVFKKRANKLRDSQLRYDNMTSSEKMKHRNAVANLQKSHNTKRGKCGNSGNR